MSVIENAIQNLKLLSITEKEIEIEIKERIEKMTKIDEPEGDLAQDRALQSIKELEDKLDPIPRQSHFCRPRVGTLGNLNRKIQKIKLKI